MPRTDTGSGDSSAIDGLTVVALAYLALPNLIFLFGWFRLPLAALLLGIMSFVLYRTIARRPIRRHWPFSAPVGLLLAATSLIWAAFGGGSHFMHANHDWAVRDAVMGDLAFADWPVIYRAFDGTPLVLRSAIGYFLPPALFAKLFGATHLDIAIHLWTAAGLLIFLALLPLPQRVGGRLALALLVTIFFSGMDILGLLIATQSMPIFPLRLEWWVPLSYPSLTGQLLWAPNHCLPLWIGTLLVYRHRAAGDILPLAAALLPLTLIWTPFAVIGLAPFIILAAWEALRRGDRLETPWTALCAGALFSLPVVLFLLLDFGNIPSRPATQFEPGSGASTAQSTVSLDAYLIFVTCEFLLLAMALAPHVRRSRPYFAISVLLLLLLPAIRFGPSNDLLLRLSTPPLVILLVVCLQTLLAQRARALQPTLWIAWLFLAIGAHTAFNELWRTATFPYWKADYRKTLADRQGGQPAAHYAGRLESPLLMGLLKPVREERMLLPGNPRPAQQ